MIVPYGDNFIPIVEVDYSDWHTEERVFCDDPKCLCHEEPDMLAVINEEYQAGLLTAEEATRTIEGKML